MLVQGIAVLLLTIEMLTLALVAILSTPHAPPDVARMDEFDRQVGIFILPIVEDVISRYHECKHSGDTPNAENYRSLIVPIVHGLQAVLIMSLSGVSSMFPIGFAWSALSAS